MRARPVRYLAAGMTLVGLFAAGLVSPTTGRAMEVIAARAGPAALAWTLVLVVALALVLTGAAEIARDVLIRSEILRQRQALAEARSVSLFSDEALAGVIALGDMGRQVEVERQALSLRSGVMALAAVAVPGLGGTAAALGLRQQGSLPGALIALAASLAAAAILMIFARSIRRTARGLSPTPAQVHAALARHQEREEAERRLLRPNLAALATVVGDRA